MNIKNVVTMFFLGISVANAATQSVDPNAAMVKQTINKFMQENHIPGVAVEMYVNGKPYSYYFGYADEKKKTPISKNTIFEVGSISKLMTSLLLAQEVDMAKLNLNDSVRKYDSHLSPAFDKVTFMTLATHTSGLPFKPSENVKTQEELTNYLANWQGNIPGDQYMYSNFGIGMIGSTLENETHQDYSKLYQAHILSPLKMQNIVFSVPARYKKFYAQGYDKDGNAVEQSKTQFFPSAGALRISAQDMQRFLSASIGLPGTPERILYPMRMTQTAYVRLPERSQGLGWQISTITPNNVEALLDEPEEMNFGPVKVQEVYQQPKYDGNALIDKTGATEGFRSYIALIPNKKSGIVILTNKFVSNAEIVDTGREILFQVAKIGTEHKETPQEVTTN